MRRTNLLVRDSAQLYHEIKSKFPEIPIDFSLDESVKHQDKIYMELSLKNTKPLIEFGAVFQSNDRELLERWISISIKFSYDDDIQKLKKLFSLLKKLKPEMTIEEKKYFVDDEDLQERYNKQVKIEFEVAKFEGRSTPNPIWRFGGNSSNGIEQLIDAIRTIDSQVGEFKESPVLGFVSKLN